MKNHILKSNEEQTRFVLNHLKTFADSNYLLVLSGGTTPTHLYQKLSSSVDYHFPKDVLLADDRWDKDPMHLNSNAKMIADTGLLERILKEGSVWNPVLTGIDDPHEEALRFENNLNALFSKYGNNIVVIAGMGFDCHTMGILPGSLAISAVNSAVFYESEDIYSKRISITIPFIKSHFKNVFLLLNDQQKIHTFNDIVSRESDISEFPVLIYKDLEEVHILCIYQ